MALLLAGRGGQRLPHPFHPAVPPAARLRATAPSGAPHRKAECALRDHPALGRWLKQHPTTGRLSINTAKITAEARLDGKYLLATSDPDLSAEDIALGYKNLLEAERAFLRSA